MGGGASKLVRQCISISRDLFALSFKLLLLAQVEMLLSMETALVSILNNIGGTSGAEGKLKGVHGRTGERGVDERWERCWELGFVRSRTMRHISTAPCLASMSLR